MRTCQRNVKGCSHAPGSIVTRPTRDRHTHTHAQNDEPTDEFQTDTAGSPLRQSGRAPCAYRTHTRHHTCSAHVPGLIVTRQFRSRASMCHDVCPSPTDAPGTFDARPVHMASGPRPGFGPRVYHSAHTVGCGTGDQSRTCPSSPSSSMRSSREVARTWSSTGGV